MVSQPTFLNKIISIQKKKLKFFNFSIPLQGKTEAIELKTVSSLVVLLKDEDVHVKCKSALALEAYA
jgi:hypothetical protein